MDINMTQVGQGIAFAFYVAIFATLFYRMAAKWGFSNVERVAWAAMGCVPGINVVALVILLFIRPKSLPVTVR